MQQFKGYFVLTLKASLLLHFLVLNSIFVILYTERISQLVQRIESFQPETDLGTTLEEVLLYTIIGMRRI